MKLFFQFVWRHGYDAVILGLVLALSYVTYQNHTRERIVIEARGGKMIYDRSALEKLLKDLSVRDEIDMELDHTWVELSARHDPKVNAILQEHVDRIKELQAKLH
jgi:hypothetical protein